ncbi:hypothetical protein BT93_D1084 [Corymbia citriodora subsp. variegata]|nr:hypothetical protein BT93_D1084 [Corymbia citriodora subsp. variegata]
MARQAKKQHHRGQKKSQDERGEITDSSSWPDLPRPLLNAIRDHPLLMRSMTFGVTTKSWRSSKPAPCSPSNRLQLQLLDTSPETDITHFSVVLPLMWLNHWRYSRRGLSCWRPWTHLVGYSHDVVVARGGASLSEVYLWNPVETWYSSLPPWDCKVPFKRAVVNSPYTDRTRSFDRAVMVVTGMDRPAYVICNLSMRQPGKEFKWVKCDCNVEDPNYGNGSERRMEFVNAVGANGKFYALSTQGTLVVIECVGSGAEIIAICPSRAVPNASWRSFRECLLEIEGEVLMVFLVCRRTVKVVDDVEVLRLNVDNYSWSKASNFRDRAFFMGANCCFHVLVSEEGWCRRNCIYFMQNAEEDVWWVFDMEKSCISRCWHEENCPVGLNLI